MCPGRLRCEPQHFYSRRDVPARVSSTWKLETRMQEWLIWTSVMILPNWWWHTYWEQPSPLSFKRKQQWRNTTSFSEKAPGHIPQNLSTGVSSVSRSIHVVDNTPCMQKNDVHLSTLKVKIQLSNSNWRQELVTNVLTYIVYTHDNWQPTVVLLLVTLSNWRFCQWKRMWVPQ